MDGFAWAENNLRVDTALELQGKGVNVYFAPNVRPEAKVVNLDNGRVEWFQPEERRPQTGCFADYEGLMRYCRENGIPLNETDEQMSAVPAGFEQAGDPIHHGAT
jgi:hypothetical protein